MKLLLFYLQKEPEVTLSEKLDEIVKKEKLKKANAVVSKNGFKCEICSTTFEKERKFFDNFIKSLFRNCPCIGNSIAFMSLVGHSNSTYTKQKPWKKFSNYNCSVRFSPPSQLTSTDYLIGCVD